MAESTPPPEMTYTLLERPARPDGDVGSDLDLIGKHCDYEYCGQLDFLPFRCESCKHTFCLDHRTETAHKCPREGEWAKARAARRAATGEPSQQSLTPCSKCKTEVDMSRGLGVHCSTCRRDYCLKHRLQEDHDCKSLEPIIPRNTAADKTKSALARLKAWTKSRSISKPSTSRTVAQMADIRKSAKGDAKIPSAERIYLTVEAESVTASTIFVSEKFTIGRVLDIAANELKVKNVNNRGGGEEERLRVFWVEGGRVLKFSERTGDIFLRNGLGGRHGTIALLRGIGDPDS